MICPMCAGAGGISREDAVALNSSVVTDALDNLIEHKMGGPPNLCTVGKSVDLRVTIDILELCDIVGGRWGEWAEKVLKMRQEVQAGYNKRDSVAEYKPGENS